MFKSLFWSTITFAFLFVLGTVRGDFASSAMPAANPRIPMRSVRKLETPSLKERSRNPALDLSDLSDLRHRSRNIAIFTTASLPWLTGTSINPLLRAIFLERAAQRHNLTLCIPFIPMEQQSLLHPQNIFESPKDQENFIRDWVREKHGYETNIRISFYPAKFVDSIGSIIATGDMIECIPELERDVAVLEEPEHLNWFHKGSQWCDVFNFVVGVVHTKYLFYRSRDAHISPALRPAWTYGWEVLNAWVARAYCHHVIKLSDAVQEFANAVTCNVHGVRDSYRKIGLDRNKRTSTPRFQKGAYYIGKVLWSKGYRELVDKMKAFRDTTGINLPVDCWGSGPDLEEVKAEVAREGLDFRFPGAIDHADPALREYKILINPSLSDVVCTTSAEALAMGKQLLCPVHPSNEFFVQFPNTVTYNHANDTDFACALQQLIDRDPEPITNEVSWKLSWDSATERFYDACAAYASCDRSATDKWLAKAHAVAVPGLKRAFGVQGLGGVAGKAIESSDLKQQREAEESVKTLDDIGRKIIAGTSDGAACGFSAPSTAPSAGIPSAWQPLPLLHPKGSGQVVQTAREMISKLASSA